MTTTLREVMDAAKHVFNVSSEMIKRHKDSDQYEPMLCEMAVKQLNGVTATIEQFDLAYISGHNAGWTGHALKVEDRLAEMIKANNPAAAPQPELKVGGHVMVGGEPSRVLEADEAVNPLPNPEFGGPLDVQAFQKLVPSPTEGVDLSATEIKEDGVQATPHEKAHDRGLTPPLDRFRSRGVNVGRALYRTMRGEEGGFSLWRLYLAKNFPEVDLTIAREIWSAFANTEIIINGSHRIVPERWETDLLRAIFPRLTFDYATGAR